MKACHKGRCVYKIADLIRRLRVILQEMTTQRRLRRPNFILNTSEFVTYNQKCKQVCHSLYLRGVMIKVFPCFSLFLQDEQCRTIRYDTGKDFLF